MASATEPVPAAAGPVDPVEPASASPETPSPPEPASGTATRPSRNTAQASGSSKARTERNPLITRIERLEKRLRSVWLPVDERQQARTLLEKARSMAREAETPEARRQLSNNLDIWERRYLGG